MMAGIFAFSSRASTELPNFGLMDFAVKKGGHLLGYGLLALSYWRGLRFNRKYIWLAWALAVLYAMTDEFHQSFVPGRHPSLVDVFGFDGIGAAIALGIGWLIKKPKNTG